MVKDLATHTIGTVAAPGTILMTLVPQGEDMLAVGDIRVLARPARPPSLANGAQIAFRMPTRVTILEKWQWDLGLRRTD